MKWGFRWYGEGDSIPLQNVRQIPGINGVIGTLLNKLPGDIWEIAEIEELKQLLLKQQAETVVEDSTSRKVEK